MAAVESKQQSITHIIKLVNQVSLKSIIYLIKKKWDFYLRYLICIKFLLNLINTEPIIWENINSFFSISIHLYKI